MVSRLNVYLTKLKKIVGKPTNCPFTDSAGIRHLKEESIGGERVGGGLDGLVGRLVPQGGRVEASHPRRV